MPLPEAAQHRVQFRTGFGEPGAQLGKHVSRLQCALQQTRGQQLREHSGLAAHGLGHKRAAGQHTGKGAGELCPGRRKRCLKRTHGAAIGVILNTLPCSCRSGRQARG